jgi:pimeloyl-ACP methyl ester carboxylesterase
MPLPAPVIVLPGIMGSTLRDEYPVAPEQVWNVGRYVAKQYERITLHPSDPRYEVLEPARVVRDHAFPVFYGELVEELRFNLSARPDEPVPVFPFGYDWRQPLAATERYLRDFIEEVVQRTALLRHYRADGFTATHGRVNLVAHSMGGLIVAGYLQANGDARVHRMATIAAPFRGSLEAVAKTAIGVGGFSLGIGGSREREAARMTPALYHLLPSFAGALRTGDAQMLFDPQHWQRSIVGTIASFIARHGVAADGDVEAAARAVLGSLLQEAQVHRARLEALRLDDPTRWLCIVGIDEKTRLDVAIADDAQLGPRFVLSDATNAWRKGRPSVHTGDGTVPFLGARCAFIPEEQVVCVRPGDFGLFEVKDRLLAEVGFHSALPSMNLVQRLVVNHLRAA